MTALQKVNLGTAPAGSDGDAVRTAFVKDNANVDVLNSQTALTSATLITTAQALTTAHIGKRVNVNLTTAGTINLPAASTCAVDQVTLLRNTGTTLVTLAITSGSGDTVSVSKLNPGETALMDVDGVHTWTCLMRGRTNSDNETVNGNCSVVGNETVGGTLSVTGVSTLASASVTGNATVGGTLGVTGQGTFTLRPTFAGKTPWDNGNLVSPATTDTTQTISGAKTFSANGSFSAGLTVSGVGTTQSYTGSILNLWATGSGNPAGIGFNSAGIGALMRLDTGSNGFQFLNFNASSYINITCSTVTQVSDIALKTNIAPVTGVLQKLRNKRAVSYVFKSDANKVSHLGVIAQEWLEDFPELVVDAGVDTDEDGDFIAHQYDEDGNEIFGPNGKPKSRRALGFNYANSAAVALQGVIELEAVLSRALERIADLEAKLA